MSKTNRLARSPVCQISCDGQGVSVSIQKCMDTRPMHSNRERLRRHNRLPIYFLAWVLILVFIPNCSIEPDGLSFHIVEQYSETFQEYKKRMDYEKQIWVTHKAMMKAIAGYKEKKRLKRSKK